MRAEASPTNGGYVELTTCVIAPSELGRAAYLTLLRHELGLSNAFAVNMDFSSVCEGLRKQPGLVLADADVRDQASVDAVGSVRQLAPAAKLLMFGSPLESASVRLWSGCRMHGYVIKDGGIPELRAAIESVLADQEYFSPGIRPLLEAGPADNGVLKLSRRESELLPLLARGLSLRDAANQMSVSYKTAESYRTSLLRKVGARDRVELARFAIRNGIVEA